MSNKLLISFIIFFAFIPCVFAQVVPLNLQPGAIEKHSSDLLELQKQNDELLNKAKENNITGPDQQNNYEKPVIEIQQEAYVQDYINIAGLYLESKIYNTAIEYFNYALQSGKQNDNAYYGLSKCYLGLEDFEKAESYLLKAQELAPDNKEYVSYKILMTKKIAEFQKNKSKKSAQNVKPQFEQSAEYRQQTSDKASEDHEVAATDNSKTVFINTVIINNSKILSKDEINNIVCDLKGKRVGTIEINNAIKKINNLYKEKEYITAKAYIPPQKLKGGVLKIILFEGKVGKVVVQGNKHTRKAYIVDKLSDKPGDIFQVRQLERDLIKFNRTNDVKLKAKIKAGEEPGTTDIYLAADDPNPFHLTPTFDKSGRNTIGLLRGGVAAADDSLLGYRDRLTIGSSLARSTDAAYASYDFPIFNKGTRIGGSFSYSNIKVTDGAYKDDNIGGNSYNYGVFITHPFISTPKFTLNGVEGFNFKQSTTTFGGEDLFTNQVRSLLTGVNAQYNTKKGIWYTSHNFYNGLDLMGSNTNFFKYEGNLTRVHDLGKGFIGLLRASTQLSPDNLPSIEQFQLGGISSARGYSEGLLVGNNGYLLSAELLTPIPLIPESLKIPYYFNKTVDLKIKDRIKGVVFCDHGAAYPDKGPEVSAHSDDYLTSVGLGLRISFSKYLGGRLLWGFGLDKREYNQPTSRFHFDLQSNPF